MLFVVEVTWWKLDAWVVLETIGGGIGDVDELLVFVDENAAKDFDVKLFWFIDDSLLKLKSSEPLCVNWLKPAEKKTN